MRVEWYGVKNFVKDFLIGEFERGFSALLNVLKSNVVYILSFRVLCLFLSVLIKRYPSKNTSQIGKPNLQLQRYKPTNST